MEWIRMDRLSRMYVVVGLVVLAALACTPSAKPGMTEVRVQTLAPRDLLARVEGGKAPVLLDVRSPGEFAAGHIPGAMNIPVDELAARIGDIPASSSDDIVVYCESGRRAAAAQKTLIAAGFTSIFDLTGHMRAWRQMDLPCVGC